MRCLIVEGNVASAREAHRDTYGMTPAASYGAVVAGLAPDAICDIVMPAEAGANLPDPAGLAGYDAIFLTGSALNIYKPVPEVTRQIDFMREVYKAGTPVFGSCWGIQMGVVAAGGTVHLNPAGRELGFARRITRTAQGSDHPLLAGRPASWDAPAIHEDEVALPPEGDWRRLAGNSISPFQAIEITRGETVFWGVQYHPEFSLKELAAIFGRRKALLTGEGFFADVEAAGRYCEDLETLHAAPARKDIAWKLGLDEQVLDPALRLTEIANFLTHLARPTMSARDRA
jgi:GMP synthase (glutamine-hydrolysing)